MVNESAPWAFAEGACVLTMSTQTAARPSRARTMESNVPAPRDNSATEDSSGSADGPTRRKFQRTTSSIDTRPRKVSNSTAPAYAARPLPADAAKTGASTRRQLSVREHHKVPLGPRPLDPSRQRHAASPSKPPGATADVARPDNNINDGIHGLARGAPSEPTVASQQVTSRSFPASEPVLTSPAALNAPFSFGQPVPPSNDSACTASTASSASYDFLPQVNFDDFHTSITGPEPTLSDFPAPGSGGVSIFPPVMPVTQMLSTRNTGDDSFAPGNGTDTRPPRGTSLLRRFSQSRNNSNTSSNGLPDVPSLPQPTSNISIRTRRQSHFPTSTPPNPASRGSRKSIGPGMLSTLDGRDARQDASKLSAEPPQGRVGRTPSFSSGGRRVLSANLTAEPQRMTAATRSAKAKSMQPPPRQPTTLLSTSSLTPEARSPGRSTRTHTPSSSARRQSHVSGLGARTISPTDARRLKRLSMNPNPPAIPVSPRTPQGDFTFEEKGLNSPAVVLRNSATPSSARGTPDQNNRKSYTSGISLSSNSSLNSLRLPTTSILARGNPALAGSRLPTPKSRNVHSSAGVDDEEDVPPVPAIPKAFESPKDPEHSSFSLTIPSPQKSTVPASQQPAQAPAERKNSVQASTLQGLEDAGPVPKQEPAVEQFSNRSRRGLTVGSGDVEKAPKLPQASKKTLQPLRLPPLNLPPLGTNFNHRMSSFPIPDSDLNARHSTPPPKRATNKTPSTPMTASKASFFTKNGSDYFDRTLRSSSSAYNLRAPETPVHDISAMPIPTLNPGRQTTTTPYSSTSLPKGTGEFARLTSRPSGEFVITDTEMQNMKANPPAVPKHETKPSTHTEQPEPGTPSSGTSLRRKLSLGGWRRSTKPASHMSQANPSSHRSEQLSQVAKQNEMPPPRMPASASAVATSSPTPSTRTRPSVEYARRKASNATVASDTELDKPQGPRQVGHTNTSRNTSGYGDQATSKSNSLLNPMQRMLGSKASTSVLRSRHLDPNLDRDDLAADEEMRKLASKRKDFEAAAREVDELRKRAKPQERVTPNQALQMVNLNIFERGEIIDYKEIYFCGTKNAKKHVGDLSQQTLNFGYDDDRGDYKIVLGDHLAYRYEVVDVLGKGSFGQVVRCVDHKTGLLVAIKIIRNKKRFHQQALVEVNILQKLREWDPENKHSMINFTQSFYFRGHLCISTELLGMNLYEFIKAHDFKGFSLRLIRRFCKQMLSSLVLLRSHRVIHCDLKPENILLAHPLHSEIKVIDFGSSCFETEKVYTYIQSRFYRSPEVILGMSYGLPIDMWSLGCILAELLTGYPIFPGENEQEQLACIMEIFGPPEKHLIEKSSRKKLFFDSLGKPRVTVSSKGRRRRPSSKTLQQALKCDDEAFLDFIARCLRWDPDRRMKPDDAMHHEFITGVRRSSRRPMANGSSTFSSSPLKRPMPAQQRARPLPEPPVAGTKSGPGPVVGREHPASSPIKGPRRHSTVQGGPSSTAAKRTANGTVLPPISSSALPRAQRSVSGKPDLASAAAAASLKTR